ncbi:MAG: nucleotidyltransferase family protein [Holophagales bacterium]|nr:nucleotidyltransferase family protein [Holophagales bacterium]MYF05559.1 nucleotidyltransferase family protein [Holophagales bacterium]MYJ26086.1 nucleotidyltransferase family protein [Holophagales bacterium]
MIGPVSGVVLAAGLSTRFETGADKPKQLYRIDGESLVRRTCRAALMSALGEVILVTGYATRRVRSEIADLDLRRVHNPAYAEGQSGSVRCGLAAVADDAEGAMFLPVDQPALDAAVIDRLLGAFGGPGSIVVPTFRGRRGAPATFGRDWFARLKDLRGDEGARPLLRELAAHVKELELDSERPLVDIDTEAEARSWIERSGPP